MDKVNRIRNGDCRSPHGERGLKCDGLCMYLLDSVVALLMESVD